MTREPAPVRVTDEQVEWLIKAQATGYSAAWDLRGLLLDLREARAALAAMTVERDRARAAAEWEQLNKFRAEARAEEAEAALAAMRSTPVGKLMADRDELTQDVQRLMKDRDRLREALTWFRDRAFCNITPRETVERINAALAAGGGENDAASGDAGAEVEQAKSGVAPVALPNDAADSPAQAATPPPPAPSRADLLALVEAGVRAGIFAGAMHETDNKTMAEERAIVNGIAARVLAAWEART